MATPEQTVNANATAAPPLKKLKEQMGAIRSASKKLIKASASQLLSQPVSTEEHDDIGGDGVGRSVFTEEEIEEEIDRMSVSGAFSDDADQNENKNDGAALSMMEVDDSADDEVDELDDDEASDFSFFQSFFGKFAMIAIGLLSSIGDLANVEEDSETGIDEMYGLALKYLFGDLTDDEKLEIDAWALDIGVFTDIELETMQKAGISSNDNWTEVIDPKNLWNIVQTKFTGFPDHMQVFLKMEERVGACAKAFANAKDNSSTPTLKDYFHSKATGDDELEARLNKSLQGYLKKQAEDTELCFIKDQRSATVSDSIFTVVANMFITNVKDFNSMDLLGSNSRKALTELLSDVTQQKVKSKSGAIYQGLKHWRKEGKGVLSAAKDLFETMTEDQQDIVIKKIKDATELKTMKSYMTTKGRQKDYYSPNGKGKLMNTSKLFTICPNTDSLIMSSEAEKEEGKNSAFLALPDDGFAVDANVLKLLQKYHKHQLKASPESQLKYMQSVLKLFEKFNCSSAQLTDPILKLFKEAMDQLQGCADNGRDRETARRIAKKRPRRDGNSDSDSESVDSNVTTTTTGSHAGTPERKKQKQNDGD